MNALIIGVGAAGNKAVINLVEKGVIEQKNVVLVNSTYKDIPTDYRDKAAIISDGMFGCGKERSVAKELCFEALKTSKFNLNQMVEPEHSKAIIVTSLEGGTGCGASVVIGAYLSEVVGINVEIIGFAGFEEDPRGLQNTIEFFQDIRDDFSIQIIRNSAFLKDANNNKLKAEKLANDELARRVTIELGSIILPSDQNIDETDHFKLMTTNGYTTIEYKEIDEKIKTTDQFNSIISDMINSTKSLESSTPAMKRLGVIMNLSESSQENIDYSFKIIKDKLGNPYEVFTHVQNEEELPQFISFVAAGMKLPKEEVEEIFNRYNKQSNGVDKNEDSFFSDVKNLKGNLQDNKFNLTRNTRRDVKNAESAFFNSFGSSSVDNNKKNNLNVKDNSEY